MENALSPSDSTGHSGNVALFIPRSMRGCRRRRLGKRAKERRGETGRKRSRRGGETRWRTKKGGWMGWTCTILHSISRHFYIAAFAPVLRSTRLFFPRFNSSALAFFFSRTFALPFAVALDGGLSRMNLEVPGDPGTRNVATASLHASPVTAGERYEIHLVFCKDSSSYCRSSKFRRLVSLTSLRGTTMCDPNEPCDCLRILFVVGLTDKIAPLRPNNVRARSFRDPTDNMEVR